MRLKITRRTRLALRALAHLAVNNGSPVSGRKLAADLATTAHYLPQVMKPLVNIKYVASTPGPLGGYSLAVDLDEAILLDVIEASEGPFDLGQCISTGEPCPREAECALHIPWTRAKHAVLAELGVVTLDALAPNSELGG